jgi:hypothetical protein
MATLCAVRPPSSRQITGIHSFTHLLNKVEALIIDQVCQRCLRHLHRGTRARQRRECSCVSPVSSA